MLIGYARVSSKEQNLDRQLDRLEKYGCEHIVQEKISGATRDREKLNQLLEKVRFKDVVVVTELSRIARSLKDLLAIIEELHEKEAAFYAIKENIDTRESNPHSKFVLSMLGALAEYERELIRERQLEGIELAKVKGKYKGKKVKYNDSAKGKDRLIYDKVIEMLERNESVMDIHRVTGLARNTIYKIKKDQQQLLDQVETTSV